VSITPTEAIVPAIVSREKNARGEAARLGQNVLMASRSGLSLLASLMRCGQRFFGSSIALNVSPTLPSHPIYKAFKKGGGGAAETLVMHDQRTNTMRPLPPAGPAGPTLFTRFGATTRNAFFALIAVATLHSYADAQVQNAGFEPDYEASGFVAPAGMPSPDAYYSAVEQASFFGPNGSVSSQMQSCNSGCGQVGCSGGCGNGACGAYAEGYNGQGGCGGCGAEGCQSCGGLTNFRFMCLFCRGGGCSVCQSIGRGYLLGCLGALMPYGEAGLCAQRWYDFSADAMFLGRTRRTSSQALTSRGSGGPIVLDANDADDDSLEAGLRLSASFIFGAGSNIEATYLGGQEWGETSTVRTLTTIDTPVGGGLTRIDGDLFSFLSEFGTIPSDGQDDTDRSLVQGVRTFSTFHSAEINYRRRTVEQYCRFQGSWLVGLRYLRFDDDFGYFAQGARDNAITGNLTRFFDYSNGVDNKMFGPQAGFDLWWNVIAGVNLGIGVKSAWLDNNIDRHSIVSSNSVGPGATPGQLRLEDGINKSTFMTEFEATMLYRISHSWTLKSQYYLMSVDDVAYGFDLSAAENVVANGTLRADPIETSSLTIQGISLGAEYVW